MQGDRGKLQPRKNLNDERRAMNIYPTDPGIPESDRETIPNEVTSSAAFPGLVFLQNALLPLAHALQEFNLAEITP